MRPWAKARTLWRLGPLNLLRVGAYRVLLRSGFYRLVLPIEPPLEGPFIDWSTVSTAPSLPPCIDATGWSASAERVLAGQLPMFSHWWTDAGFPPAWHRSLLTGIEADAPLAHWTLTPDFGLPGGDVKGYWEPARFDGLLILVLGWLCTRRPEMRQGIDRWLESWCAENPANAGLQWKCGQEAGIRLMQLLLAVELLQRWSGASATPALCRLVAQHCARIAPTLLYAIGQDNNHGTSEAAALFIGGCFLVRHAPPLRGAGSRWRAAGRRWLENRLARLVMADGSFSQHSVNYHRVLLDTCSLAETFRRRYDEPPFSARALERCRQATLWLAGLTDPRSGDAPNLGANDGARLFVLHRKPYRDFRPALQWATQLFGEHRSPAGECEQLAWLGLDPVGGEAAVGPDDDPLAATRAASAPKAPATRFWPDGGYATLSAPRTWALLRLPRYAFRPSHSDALHLDLWLDGDNVLCDGGTFSYNTDARWLRYFSGTESHNTVQFDGRDQMPRLSRFLFGDWLQCRDVRFDAAGSTVEAGYRDSFGALHRRRVTLAARHCRVVDEISGLRERAVLRWRLAPRGRTWACDGEVCSDGALRIATRSSVPIARLELVEGWQSTHYADKTPLPVLEVEVRADATLVTDITWPE